MATEDADEKIVDFVLAVVGDRAAAIDFLTSVGERFGLAREDVEAHPVVSLRLGDIKSRPGWSMVFHLSAFESELARHDARIVLAERGGEAPMELVKAATREALMRAPDVFLPMPHCVREGLHRHDRAAAPVLEPDGPPKRGQNVKVQVNLREPLACANYPGEVMDWLAMGGVVTAVRSENEIEVELVATTDRAPAYFDGEWRGRLVRVPDFDFPWVLSALARRETR